MTAGDRFIHNAGVLLTMLAAGIAVLSRYTALSVLMVVALSLVGAAAITFAFAAVEGVVMSSRDRSSGESE